MQLQGPRTARYSDQQAQDEKRRKQIRNWLLLLVGILVIVALWFILSNLQTSTAISISQLPCTADQDVKVFGDNILYYDGVSLHCVSGSGSIKWSFSVGSGAQYAVSDTNIVIWSGKQLFIVNSNGNPSYNEDMAGEIQFARIGSRYCAVVIGEDTEPELIIKSLDGTQVDNEIDAFSGLMLMDVGFYGDNDQYMWTLAMDIYGTAINTVLNTFQVSRMNNGQVSLGQYLAYKVLYEDGRLRVFTTQQMYTYDYKAVQDSSRTELVYGWQLIDSYIPKRGSAHMLLAPTSQMTGSLTMTELRVITDTLDRRYSLPSECVGAGILEDNLYAIASDYLYHANLDKQRFSGYSLSLPNHAQITSLIGLTDNYRAVVAAGSSVYTITLPR